MPRGATRTGAQIVIVIAGAAAADVQARPWRSVDLRASWAGARELSRCARHAARGDPNPRQIATVITETSTRRSRTAALDTRTGPVVALAEPRDELLSMRVLRGTDR